MGGGGSVTVLVVEKKETNLKQVIQTALLRALLHLLLPIFILFLPFIS